MFAPAQNTRSSAPVTTTQRTLGVLEAQPLDRVGELDVDADVVAVELQLVVPEAPLGLDVHRQRRDVSVDREAPVHVVVGVGLEAQALGEGGGGHVVGGGGQVADGWNRAI